MHTNTDAHDNPAPSRRWLWIASIWFGFGLFDAMQTVFVMRAEGMHHAWVLLLVTTAVSWLPWALATPFVLRLGRRFPPAKLRPFSAWLAHAAACASIGLIFAADDGAGSPVQPVFRRFADAAVRTPLVRQVLQRDSFVARAVRRDPCGRLCAGFERAPGASAD